MPELTSIEITCADDYSFALNRALWMERLVEVFIMPGQGTALDDFGNFVISFWRENEEEPRDEMRTRVGMSEKRRF